MEVKQDDPPVCYGCNNEIDPELCHCGMSIEDHDIYCGHSPVPMGCDCYRIEPTKVLKRNT